MIESNVWCPSGCGRDDGVGFSFPEERLRFDVMFGEVAVDGGLEVDDAEEGAPPEASFGEGGEEAFDGFSRKRWSA